MPNVILIIHHDDGDKTELRGSGYAVRCAAHIAHENLPDARWALKVLNTYGHLVRHEADQIAAAPPFDLATLFLPASVVAEPVPDDDVRRVA